MQNQVNNFILHGLTRVIPVSRSHERSVVDSVGISDPKFAIGDWPLALSFYQ